MRCELKIYKPQKTATETKKTLLCFSNTAKCTENTYKPGVQALPEDTGSSHSLLKASNNVGRSNVDVASQRRYFWTRFSYL